MYTYRLIVSPLPTYTIILHLEIECLLYKSFITKNFGNSHSLLVNFMCILSSLKNPSLTSKKKKKLNHSSLPERQVL